MFKYSIPVRAAMRQSRRELIERIAVATGVLGGIGTASATESPAQEWDPETVYRDGDRVSHGGYNWEAYWYTVGQQPADTAAVWNRTGMLTGTTAYPDWTPAGVYRAGNRVVYDAAVWEAKWWTEGDEPTTGPSEPWERIETMDDSDGTDTDDPTDTTPVERHGQLQVVGTDLCDEDGDPVQLRGMSTHGIQWFGWDEFLTEEAIETLATDWDADLCRVAMYVQEGGYETDPEGFTEEVNRIVEAVTDRGMYAIIDFHVLDPGNPLENLDNAVEFFDAVAAEHAEKKNVIFEICNEPNNIDWGSIKEYAQEVLPVIRAHDEDSPVIVGTRGWSSLGIADIGADGPQEIIDNPVSGDNLLYAYHFYAATHGQWEREQLDSAADELPIFVSECGSMEATGDGANDFDSTRAFMDVLAEHSISWAFWSYSDDWRTSAVWQEGTGDGSWTEENLTTTGEWIRSELRSPPE